MNGRAGRRRLRQLSGWLPAVVLPAATAEQVRALLIANSHVGSSALTWGLFMLANVGARHLPHSVSVARGWWDKGEVTVSDQQDSVGV